MSFKEYIFPEICSLCKENKIYDDSYICETCHKELEFTSNESCKLCSANIDSFLDVCNQCIENKRPWSRGFAPLVFKGQSREAIHKFKYNSQLVISRLLVKLMVDSLMNYGIHDFSCITSVPMHWTKKIRRGFNQAEILASGIAKNLRIPYKDLLIRKSQSSAQALKNKSQRKSNIRQIFKINEKQKVPDGAILLVDDVLTTGTTLTACSKALLENGAREICIITAARG